MPETWGPSLGQEDLLEKGMATLSSISCLENPMDRGTWHGIAELDMTEQLTHTHKTACTAVCPPEVMHSDGHTISEVFLSQNN